MPSIRQAVVTRQRRVSVRIMNIRFVQAGCEIAKRTDFPIFISLFQSSVGHLPRTPGVVEQCLLLVFSSMKPSIRTYEPCATACAHNPQLALFRLRRQYGLLVLCRHHGRSIRLSKLMFRMQIIHPTFDAKVSATKCVTAAPPRALANKSANPENDLVGPETVAL